MDPFDEFLDDPPACSVVHFTSALNDSTTALTADSENYDNDSMHSTHSTASNEGS